MGRFMIAIWAADTGPELPIPGALWHTPLTCPIALHLLLDREDVQFLSARECHSGLCFRGKESREKRRLRASGGPEPPCNRLMDTGRARGKDEPATTAYRRHQNLQGGKSKRGCSNKTGEYSGLPA